MRIYFARHGESHASLLREISNRGLRHGLTRQGRVQANALADALAPLPLTRILTSPLLRAIETAVILANRLGLEFEVEDGLREYDCGALEGRSDEAAWRRWKELADAWEVRGILDMREDGGENFLDIRDRFRAFVDRLLRRYRDTDEAVLCVSHGGFYRVALPLVLAHPGSESLSGQGFGYASCLVSESRPEGLVFLGWVGSGTQAGSS